MFSLTRLLLAGVVFVFAAMSVATVATFTAIVIAAVMGVPLDNFNPFTYSTYQSIPYLADLSDNFLEAIGDLLLYILLAVAGIITLVFISKLIERRSLAEVGLGHHGLLRNTVLGFGIGVGEALLYVLLLILAIMLGLSDPQNLDLNSIDWQPFGVLGNLALTFAFTGFLAVAEEIVFRGFLFRTLEEGLGSWLALVISSLLFGMAHLGNFNDPSLLDVTSQMAGGLALAAAYMLTRKLWLPIGIHWGWDFMVFAISGGDIVSLMNDLSDSGGALDTVLGVLPDLILGIVLLALVIQRRQVFTPRWMQLKRTHKPYMDESLFGNGEG
jgi:membrane protease YdiL (CAAX protease family)